MYKKIFLDANILIDIFDENRIFYHDSLKLYQECLKRDIAIYTSCDILTNIYYINSKHLSRDVALDSIDILLQTLNIISFDKKDAKEVIKLMKQNQKYHDFEDSLQYILAKNSSCEAIISNDKNFFSQDIPLFTSKEFVKRYLS
jgi:predicted nucleic acid-binding protein